MAGHPQQREIIRYFRGEMSRSLNGLFYWTAAAVFPFDVLSWLAEQKVALIRIGWKGDIVCVAGAQGYSANPFRVKWQLETRENPAKRNDFCRSIITQKIEVSILTLEKSIRRSDQWERAMKSLYAALSRQPRRKTARKHFRTARIGGELRGIVFSQLGRNTH